MRFVYGSACLCLNFYVLSCQQRNAGEVPANVAPKANASGMVAIPAGTFAMGTDDEMFSDAQPIHEVAVSAFLLDEAEVTNRAFAAFVSATHYVTQAETAPRAHELPGVPREQLVAGSLTFAAPQQVASLENPSDWWAYVPGANWRHPEGPSSNIAARMDHPVVHVTWRDADRYCHWAAKRLPTEAEWEYGARGGLKQKRFAWGNEERAGEKYMANVWQGRFPSNDVGQDGFVGTAPVKRYAPNGYGLYDVAGNVWEWCQDFYQPAYYKVSPHKNPQGPSVGFDPDEPNISKRVQRGGSYLCSEEYCLRFVVAARGKGDPDTSSSHVGFRCAKDAP